MIISIANIIGSTTNDIVQGGTDDRFIFTVKTDNPGTSNNDQFIIPTLGSGYNYDIETSDGLTVTGITGNYTITFPSGAGTHTVYISGVFVQMYHLSTNDRDKLISIDQWGIYGNNIGGQSYAFSNCDNLVINATDTLDLSLCTNFFRMFERCLSNNTQPNIITSIGQNFGEMFENNRFTVYNDFYDFSNATNLNGFLLRSDVQDFPPNVFDGCPCTAFTNAFLLTNLTTTSIDNILVSIESNGTSNGTFTQSGGQAPSATGEAAIDSLVGRGWTITVTGGYDPTQFFIFTVKTDNAGTSASNQFTIPTSTTGITQAFNYDIETSDGQTITGVTGNHTITFPSAGTYDIYISGSFPYMYFNNGGDRLKLLDIKNFGIYALGSTTQNAAFRGCSNMLISATDSGNFGSVINFGNTWRECSSLTSFPLLDTSSGTNFQTAWRNCVSLTSFPLLDTSTGTSFLGTWLNCTSLTSFPANAFDTNIATNYTSAFLVTNLSTQSIDDILVSLETSGVSNGTFTQSGGQAPSATGQTAIVNLVVKGWTITVTGGYTP